LLGESTSTVGRWEGSGEEGRRVDKGGSDGGMQAHRGLAKEVEAEGRAAGCGVVGVAKRGRWRLARETEPEEGGGPGHLRLAQVKLRHALK